MAIKSKYKVPPCRANHRSKSVSFPQELHEKVDNAIADGRAKSFNSAVIQATEQWCEKSTKLQDKQKTGSLRK